MPIWSFLFVLDQSSHLTSCFDPRLSLIGPIKGAIKGNNCSDDQSTLNPPVRQVLSCDSCVFTLLLLTHWALRVKKRELQEKNTFVHITECCNTNFISERTVHFSFAFFLLPFHISLYRLHWWTLCSWRKKREATREVASSSSPCQAPLPIEAQTGCVYSLLIESLAIIISGSTLSPLARSVWTIKMDCKWALSMHSNLPSSPPAYNSFVFVCLSISLTDYSWH